MAKGLQSYVAILEGTQLQQATAASSAELMSAVPPLGVTQERWLVFVMGVWEQHPRNSLLSCLAWCDGVIVGFAALRLPLSALYVCLAGGTPSCGLRQEHASRAALL